MNLGFDLNVIEDQEPDAALGNGGLGRLAACFLESLSYTGISGIRMWYSVINMVCSNKKIENGYQVEVPDNWLKRWQPI